MPSVADIEGPWKGSEFESGLIARCQEYWDVPLDELPNAALAMFLRQRIALQVIIPEARKRVDTGFEDGSELFEEELACALRQTDGTA